MWGNPYFPCAVSTSPPALSSPPPRGLVRIISASCSFLVPASIVIVLMFVHIFLRQPTHETWGNTTLGEGGEDHNGRGCIATALAPEGAGERPHNAFSPPALHDEPRVCCDTSLA